MMSFDLLRIMALMPAQDYPHNSDAEKRSHKNFNYVYLGFSVILIVLLIMYKVGSVQTMNELGNLLAWAIGAVIVLWIIGFIIQLCQNLNKSNPSNDESILTQSSKIAKTGRKAMPRVESEVSPIKDEIAETALKDFMLEKGSGLSTTDGYYILNALLSLHSDFLKEEYEKKSLAGWLYSSFSAHFRGFNPISMTTPNTTSIEEQDKTTKLLKAKYLEKKQKN